MSLRPPFFTSHFSLLNFFVLLLLTFGVAAQLPTDDEIALMDTYGGDYLRYRQGRQAQAAGDHASARGHYLQLSSGLLADAGRAYTIECFLAEGDIAVALTRARGFINGNPNGYYNLDVRLALAMALYLDGNGRPQAVKAAQTAIAEALTQYETIHKQWQEDFHRQQNLPALLLLLKDDSPLDRAINDFGVKTDFALPGSKNWPGPDAIFNRQSCPWYLPWTKLRLHLLQAFLAMEAGDANAATQALAAATAALPMHDPAADAYGQRFYQAQRRGAFFYAPELRQRWQRHAANLRLTGFLVTMGDRTLPAGLAAQVLQADRADRHETAAAVLAALVCHLRANQPTAATLLLAEHADTLKRANLDATAHHLAQLAW